MKLKPYKVKELQAKQFCLDRFSSDSRLINFYTGFTDYKTFVSVFTVMQPTATTLVRRTQMQRNSSNLDRIKLHPFKDDRTPLSLIDQFFVFMYRALCDVLLTLCGALSSCFVLLSFCHFARIATTLSA